MTTDDCGSKLSAVEQVQRISTPEYPQQYSYNLTCTWRITANRDYLIRLETGFVSNDTCCEHLEVSDFCRKISLDQNNDICQSQSDIFVVF